MFLVGKYELRKLQAHHKSRLKNNNRKVKKLDETMRLWSIHFVKKLKKKREPFLSQKEKKTSKLTCSISIKFKTDKVTSYSSYD